MSDARFTPLGKLISIALIGGLIALGVYMLQRPPGEAPVSEQADAEDGGTEVAEVKVEVPALDAPATYQPRDNVVDLEISEYAGYSGLIVANGGMEPSENSVFFKNHGFKVRLSVSEEESWSALNSGKIGASVTTADVLAVYGRQFRVVVPAQIGFSRGADGLVVRTGIKRINDLKGKVIATAQFTEVDFFIRYLAQEAGLGIATLAGLDATPNPDKVNLVFTEDGFSAGDLFLEEIKAGRDRLAGCVTWEPKVSEVVSQSGGRAQVLTTNRNLLIVADVLVVNRGFAEQQPKIVAGLVEGLLEGNRLVRTRPDEHLSTIGRAFKWSPEKTRAELTKVHLSNLPENLAFFSGAIDAAGSFGGIYQSAVFAYGNEVIKDPIDSDRFLQLAQLETLKGAGAFKDEKIEIAPIRSAERGTLENDPLLSKDIRFLFEPNSATLDLSNQDNLQNLEAIRRLLKVSPGSTVLLRGHVDNGLVEEFRRKGGDSFVRKMALQAVELSKNRAGEIKRLLVEKYSADTARLDTIGRGWEEPAGSDADLNRRVEVQWFTIE
jgi:NitT/TauT family transport system substrate-binding protein